MLTLSHSFYSIFVNCSEVFHFIWTYFLLHHFLIPTTSPVVTLFILFSRRSPVLQSRPLPYQIPSLYTVNKAYQ